MRAFHRTEERQLPPPPAAPPPKTPAPNAALAARIDELEQRMIGLANRLEELQAKHRELAQHQDALVGLVEAELENPHA